MNQSFQRIAIQASLEDINKIIGALGNLPYVQVYKLIANIQQQVSEQLHENGTHPELQDRDKVSS